MPNPTYQLDKAGATVDSLLDLIGNDALTTTAQTLTGAINELDGDMGTMMPKSGGNFTGAITVNNDAVLTQSDLAPQAITLTENTTTVNNIGVATKVYKVGKLVIGTVYCQIKANVADGQDLISGLPAPYASGTYYFPMASNVGNFGYRAKITSDGKIQTVGAYATTQGWYVGNFVYISAT